MFVSSVSCSVASRKVDIPSAQGINSRRRSESVLGRASAEVRETLYPVGGQDTLPCSHQREGQFPLTAPTATPYGSKTQ